MPPSVCFFVRFASRFVLFCCSCFVFVFVVLLCHFSCFVLLGWFFFCFLLGGGGGGGGREREGGFVLSHRQHEIRLLVCYDVCSSVLS